MIVFFSGTLQVHLPRNRRLRRPVQEQGRGVRLLRAGQFHQQQNAQRLAEKIIEKKVRTSSKTFFFFSTRRCSGKTPFCYILDFSTILYLFIFCLSVETLFCQFFHLQFVSI